MSRIEAYKHMLEGKRITHRKVPDDIVWSVDLAREVMTNKANSVWSPLFFTLCLFENGWEIYDSTSG